MPMDNMDVTKKELAVGNDEDRRAEPKIYETGYFLISQQIVSFKDSIDNKLDAIRKDIDVKFSDARKETDAKLTEIRKEVSDARQETDAKLSEIRRETDTRLSEVRKEISDVREGINVLQRWAFGIIVTVVLGFVAVYFK